MQFLVLIKTEGAVLQSDPEAMYVPIVLSKQPRMAGEIVRNLTICEPFNDENIQNVAAAFVNDFIAFAKSCELQFAEISPVLKPAHFTALVDGLEMDPGSIDSVQGTIRKLLKIT